MKQPTERQHKSNLLIVEDDRDFAESLAEILTQEGYQVRTAGGEESALQIITTFSADVALVDIRLGKRNGLVLIPELKEVLPQVVCIAMTAYAHLESAIEAVQRGAYDYIRKPLDIRDLLMVLERASEKCRLEKQLQQTQKIEAVGNLAGGVAHDFNNVMTAIVGYVDLLIEDVTAGNHSKEKMLDYLDEVRRGGERATALTRQLHLFARQQVTRPVRLDLNLVVENLKKMLGRLIREDIGVDIQMDPDLPPIHADPGRVEQVIMNLAINASDAMENGGKLTIETVCSAGPAKGDADSPEDRQVVLRVRDTGCGMDQGTVERAFEPFFTTKGEGKGTGLGLWTVKNVVEEAGGEISIRSDPQKGTAVDVVFPVSGEGAIWDDKVASLEDTADGTETVLVCDDDESVREVMESVLARRGYTVLVARNGQEALHLFEADAVSIDLLVTDVVMPGMSGSDLAKRIWSRNEEMPVLFVSGYLPACIDWKEVLGPRAEYLQKPFPKEILLTRVRRLLDRIAVKENR